MQLFKSDRNTINYYEYPNSLQRSANMNRSRSLAGRLWFI